MIKPALLNCIVLCSFASLILLLLALYPYDINSIVILQIVIQIVSVVYLIAYGWSYIKKHRTPRNIDQALLSLVLSNVFILVAVALFMLLSYTNCNSGMFCSSNDVPILTIFGYFILFWPIFIGSIIYTVLLSRLWHAISEVEPSTRSIIK